MLTRIFGSEGEIDLTNNEVVAGAFEADSHRMMSIEQAIEDPSETSTLIQGLSPLLDDKEVALVAQSTFEDPIFLTTIEGGPSHSLAEDDVELVLVEDASDDEEATLIAQMTFEDPIFFTTIKDCPSLSIVEVNAGPQLVEDPSIETESYSSTRAREDEDLA
jgi:hypothetical protein